MDETADLDSLIDKTVGGAFAYSGQVCISIQRIYVQRARFDEFRDKFVARTERLLLGDPLDDHTEIGPLINDGAAERIAAWLSEATAGGAQIVAGGTHDGRMFKPTVLTDVTRDMKVVCEEVFGPVVTLTPYDEFDDALALVNNSPFGLQTGVFTRDLGRAMRAVQKLDVGGVIINDSPTFRVDQMPYGGNKLSGVGREGPRFAVEDMTTLKMVVDPDLRTREKFNTKNTKGTKKYPFVFLAFSVFFVLGLSLSPFFEEGVQGGTGRHRLGRARPGHAQRRGGIREAHGVRRFAALGQRHRQRRAESVARAGCIGHLDPKRRGENLFPSRHNQRALLSQCDNHGLPVVHNQLARRDRRVIERAAGQNFEFGFIGRQEIGTGQQIGQDRRRRCRVEDSARAAHPAQAQRVSRRFQRVFELREDHLRPRCRLSRGVQIGP